MCLLFVGREYEVKCLFSQEWWQVRIMRRCVIIEKEEEGLMGGRRAGDIPGEF